MPGPWSKTCQSCSLSAGRIYTSISNVEEKRAGCVVVFMPPDYNRCAEGGFRLPGNQVLDSPWVASKTKRLDEVDPEEVFEEVNGILLVGQEVFDHIANGNQADQLSVFQHR